MKLKALVLSHLLFLSACSQLQSHPDWVQAPNGSDLQEILSGEVLLGEPVQPQDLPDYDLMQLSPMMEVIAEELAMMHSRSFRRAEALHHTLLSSPLVGGQGIRYSALETATAREAFESKRANCLSFTLMYVAMARHMGLDARVNDVKIPPSWRQRDNEALLYFRHVNAKVRLPFGDELVVDLEMDRYSPVYEQTLISESLAAAQFYNNRGMELAAQGHPKQGFLHLRKALELDSTQSYIWGNLGTLYIRQGYARQAEVAYLAGLSQAEDDLTVMSNLSTLYNKLGETEKADYFLERAREHRESNPYYLYFRAQEKLAEDDLRGALRLLKQAIEQQEREPRFYALAAEIHERNDQSAKAEQMRKKQKRFSEDLYL